MKKLILIISVVSALPYMAREKQGSERVSTQQQHDLDHRVMANCAAPKSGQEIKYNNVRTIIYTGGDMWWDLVTNARYIIPKTDDTKNAVCSSFAGSIWLGGLDAGGQLKVAAMTYRQNGIDFWPGPLDTTNASADPNECARYDQVYTITRDEVDKFSSGKSAATPNILNWPGNGDQTKKEGRILAPFTDVNGDYFYDPSAGDYPAYDVQNLAEKDNLGFCKAKLYGDFTLFWVFNDKGGVHSETQGVPIGVEVRAEAFEFKTNDEINNMSFYSYEIFNRSSFQLNKTYFTIWNDADLGYYLDDYVGCDVKRGLGFIYNSDPFDETYSGTNGYLDYPPALGCDFFRGPLADIDGIDNNMNGVVDEPGETIQMSRFTYYNNNIGAFPPQTTNPDLAIHYYNYMTGFWKDGSAFTQGGNAYGGTSPSQFVYDGDPVDNTGWTEKNAGNLAGDRRFLQSAGPFTLLPGAKNNVTYGMPWAQSPNKGGNIESVKLLKLADDKAQALFDNCFKILDGPEAPDMTIQELNNELIIYLTNQKGSNNYRYFNNDYAEDDITILSDPSSPIDALHPDKIDKTYRFEGYIVYQVKNALVTSTDLDDITKAVPIFQCDLKNGVGRIVNYIQDNNVGSVAPKIMVEGADNGITTTFRITQDAFSTTTDRKLINNITYNFIAVAYAYNNYLTYAQDVSPTTNPSANYLGQKHPFLEGRKLKKAAGIPHDPTVEKDGTVMQSAYGYGPKITRHEGQGNGGNLMTLTQESEDNIVNSANAFYPDITYEGGAGPVNIKIVDPLNVKPADYQFRFINKNFYSVWTPSAVAGSSLFAPATPTTDLTYTTDPTVPKQWLNVMPTFATYSTNTSFYTGNGGNIAALNVDNTSWELKDLSTGKTYHPNEPSFVVGTKTTSTAYKDTLYQTIKIGNEFYFPDLGFSISIKQVADPGERVNSYTNLTGLDETYTGPDPNSFLGASMTYMNGTSGWLNGVVDIDGSTPNNWILSGNNKTVGNEDATYKYTDGKPASFYDPNKQFGNILKSTWAPYPLCASYYSLTPGPSSYPSRVFGGPAFDGRVWDNDPYFKSTYNIISTPNSPNLSSILAGPDEGNTDIRKLSSVVVVFTKDKSKWTRCPVLEMQEKSSLSEGHVPFFAPRGHLSVDKQGIPYGNPKNQAGYNSNEASMTSTMSMGWFPGYAVNIETGERLNMAFGEDSYQKENNGDDMMWNPTSKFNSPYAFSHGGKHYVYVMAGNTIYSKFTNGGIYTWEPSLDGSEYGVGRYDKGARMMNILTKFFADIYANGGTVSGGYMSAFEAFERDIMWVSIPMPKADSEFKDPANMPSDVKFQINVSKPYRYGYSGVTSYSTQASNDQAFNKLKSVNSPSNLTTDVKANPVNNNFPLYTFNTNDVATSFEQGSVAKSMLDAIRVVPNPYYGASAYENNRIDNRVRITNLPNKCTVKIFTMNGTLVRTIKRDVSGQEDEYLTGDTKQSKRVSYTDWDLKNQNNITVASGLYIFHIDAPGIGEKILKWFGVMRPLDVQNY
jgi:hypothetical protein